MLTVDDDVECAVFRVQCAFPNVESEAVLNVKIAKIYRKNQKKIGAVGDDVTWCFQGPLYIFLYGSAK